MLTPAETADLVALLAESHTGQPPAPAPTEPHTITTGRATQPHTADQPRLASAETTVLLNPTPDTESAEEPDIPDTAERAGRFVGW